MARETRHEQSRNAPRQSKASPAGKKSASGKASARRARLQAGANAEGKASQRPARRQYDDLARQNALKDFESATRYFQKRDYEKAAALFQKATAGPVREIADRARVHLRSCERMRHHEKRPRTPEGYYARGVAALNSRDFDQALQYLSRCDKMVPNQEYVHYALAAAYGLKGDPDNAFIHLETAIRLRPQNRFQARHDADFEALADDPRFAQLLRPDGREASTQGE